MMTNNFDETEIMAVATSEGPDNVENPIAAAIEAAEKFTDPLDGLVERVSDDPGAAFVPEVLERLSELKANDRAAFETLRAKLKKTELRVTSLDEVLVEKNGDAGGNPTQAHILIEIAEAAVLFHSPDGTAFADFDIKGHRETWPVRSKGFRRWLTQQFFELTSGAPNSEAMQAALNVVEAMAHFDGSECPIFVRVGGLDDKLYLDLCDNEWRVVEISETGWRVIDNSPVRFRRSTGMLSLPIPQPGGSIETLRNFLNVQTEADFVLIVAWALAVLRNCGPYPVIVLAGEQGSAKSTFSAILRALLDPNTAPLRALPREDRDLFIAASNSHVLVFDNVSSLPPWISDTLCRLATGGGFAVRQLYTDGDEVLFTASRPMILNGIEDIVTRLDLADRALFLNLQRIEEDDRRSEAVLWADFEIERPRLLGVLLDAVVHGLKTQPDTKLERLPRMADFALWATACETAIWPAGAFWSAYCGNREEAIESGIEGDPVAAAVRDLMQVEAEWKGTATTLLNDLERKAGERIAKAKSWPKTPRALSGRLRRAATFLRKIGIEISHSKEGRSSTRIIQITATSPSLETDLSGKFASARSAPSVNLPNTNENKDLTDDAMGAVGAQVADGADAKISLSSGSEKKKRLGWGVKL